MKQEKLLLREVWRKAAQSSKDTVIQCETVGKAQQFRLALYNAVKSVRQNPAEDLELHAAVERCTISFNKEAKTVIIRQAALNPLLQRVAGILGIDASKLESPEDRQGREMGERMLKQLEGAGPSDEAPHGRNPDGSPKKNPYY